MKKQKMVAAPKNNALVEKLKVLVSKATNAARRNKRRTAAGLAALVALGLVVSSIQAERNATYELRLFASSIGGPVPLDTITVKGPSHASSGAICFREELQTRTSGCVKVDLFILKRAE